MSGPQALLFDATDFVNYTTFEPDDQHDHALNTMLDKLVSWGEVLKASREANKVPAREKPRLAINSWQINKMLWLKWINDTRG
jgi:hypothetical protein